MGPYGTWVVSPTGLNAESGTKQREEEEGFSSGSSAGL